MSNLMLSPSAFRNALPQRDSANRRRGVSLMETIIVIGIMSVLMLVVTQIFLLNYEIVDKQSGRAANETGAILAAKTISQMTRGASAVEASHVFSGTTRTSSSTTLVLKMPSIDSSGNVLAATFDYVAIYRHTTNTDELHVAIDAATGSYRQDGSRRLTANNQTLTFFYNDPTLTETDRVSAYVVNSQTKRGTTLTTRGWTSIFLRNNE